MLTVTLIGLVAAVDYKHQVCVYSKCTDCKENKL